MNKNHYLFLLLLLTATCIYFSLARVHSEKLINNYNLTSGIILSCDGGGRGHPSTLFIKYKYLVDGKVIEGELGNNMYISVVTCNSNLVGKSVPVAYNPDNPLHSSILLFPDDFKQLNLHFPDSMKWVLQYMKE